MTSHLLYYKLKEALNKYDDDFFNRLARTVNRVPPEKRTLARVMASALVHHPSLHPHRGPAVRAGVRLDPPTCSAS